jgi:hypothetical protein
MLYLRDPQVNNHPNLQTEETPEVGQFIPPESLRNGYPLTISLSVLISQSTQDQQSSGPQKASR